MGAKIAHPTPPSDNAAKAESDLALSGMKAAASEYLSTIRLGEASEFTLGYDLTDQKLTSQEVHLVVKTKDNATNDDIKKGIEGIFSHDWEKVVELAANSLAQFFGGEDPTTQTEAVNDEFSKSYLIWEDDNIVQYSFYVKRTNAKSMGTVQEDKQQTLQCCLCKGNVAYDKIDPQTVVGTIVGGLGEKVAEGEVKDVVKDALDKVVTHLKLAAEVAQFKKQLEAGSIPSEPKARGISLIPRPLRQGCFTWKQRGLRDEGVSDPIDEPTREEALYSAISSGQRARVRNDLQFNVLLNGSFIERGETVEVAVNQRGGYNKLHCNGSSHVIPSVNSLISPGSSTLRLSQTGNDIHCHCMSTAKPILRSVQLQ